MTRRATMKIEQIIEAIKRIDAAMKDLEPMSIEFQTMIRNRDFLLNQGFKLGELTRMLNEGILDKK
jgi:uncharacterized protein with HEPN domain